MALSPQLLQFKSSGVYRLEFDKSQTVSIPAETIRLVVGHSKKGPYNTPVYIEDTETFVQVFGGIDKNLERKGMFFHRSCLEALSRGPILALNLTAATLDGNGEEVDRINYMSPVTNASKDGLFNEEGEAGYSEVFDTDKFWTPSDSKLLTLANNTAEDSDHAISFVNIKQDPITIIIKQAENTDGFNLTAREWYGEGNVPEGLDDLDYVSDYMVDVLVFKGLFDPATLDTDPTYGNYFTDKGIEKGKLAAFSQLREVSLEAQYTGSLIPEFQDLEGNNLYIETLINLEARRTGLFCAVNEDALSTIDLVGQTFDLYQDYELLSHIVEQEPAQQITTTGFAAALTKQIRVDGTSMIIYGVADQTEANSIEALGLTDGAFLDSATSGEYATIQSVTYNSGATRLEITTDIDIDPSVYEVFTSTGTPATVTSATRAWTDPSTTTNIILTFNDVTTDWVANDLDTNDYLESNILGQYTKISAINVDTVNNTVTIVPETGRKFATSYVTNTSKDFAPYDLQVQPDFKAYTIGVNARAEAIPSDWDFVAEGGGVATFTKEVSAGSTEPSFNSAIKVGMYLPVSGADTLARILRIGKTFIEASANDGVNDKYVYTFTTHRNVPSRPEYALKSFEDATSVYKTFPIAGAGNSDKAIADLLTQMRPGTGLANTLIDKDAITFRYIVDTFGSFENNTLLNKEELTQLCKERQNASAILNAPMVHEFKASTNPSFIDENTGSFSTRYIATGGNLNLNPTALYTLPSINEGASYGFYYGPGLTVVENGRSKIVPPAAYVSNNYIDKYFDALPWSIVAGPRRGVVGGTGVQNVEYAFDKNDRDVLEPFGINPIVFERGVGITIKGNKTAQQSVKSALSSAHVREVLIYIEDGLAAILKDYLFEFNTAQTRLEIKTLADNFMESVRTDQGVYDYRNIMDTTNNTNEVIDNNIGILDTYVEPVKGLEILVSRVTVLNTGEIATGNFA